MTVKYKVIFAEFVDCRTETLDADSFRPDAHGVTFYKTRVAVPAAHDDDCSLMLYAHQYPVAWFPTGTIIRVTRVEQDDQQAD